jgi:sec-independent protein translocase protein TatB
MKAPDGLKGQFEAEMYSVEKAVKKAIDGAEAPAPPQVAPVAAAAARTSGPPPAATLENVPGLDAALIDPLAPPRPPPPADPIEPS